MWRMEGEGREEKGENNKGERGRDGERNREKVRETDREGGREGGRGEDRLYDTKLKNHHYRLMLK